MYKIISRIKDKDGLLLGCQVEKDGKIGCISKADFKKYTYINAKISSDNRILCDDDISDVSDDILYQFTLYHGSHSGIKGAIRPDMSREACDFGYGFYTGEYERQTVSLVSLDDNSVIYEIAVNLRGLDFYKFDDALLWALYVGRCRKAIDISSSKKLQLVFDEIDKKDVIIGLIADDRMMFAFSQFASGVITDAVLIECLKYVDLGKQYVFKTRKACRRISIVGHRVLTADEKKVAAHERHIFAGTISSKISTVLESSRRRGSYVDEILERFR